MTTLRFPSAYTAAFPLTDRCRWISNMFECARYGVRLSRIINRLFDLSDGDLRKLGITRAEIMQYAERQLGERYATADQSPVTRLCAKQGQ